MKIKLNANRQQGFFFVFGPLWFVALVMGAKALADHSQRQPKQIIDRSATIDGDAIKADIEKKWKQYQKADLEKYNRRMNSFEPRLRTRHARAKGTRPVWDNNGTYSS